MEIVNYIGFGLVITFIAGILVVAVIDTFNNKGNVKATFLD